MRLYEGPTPVTRRSEPGDELAQPASIPALAAILRRAHRLDGQTGLPAHLPDSLPTASPVQGRDRALVPMYCIAPSSPEPSAEAAATAQVVVTVADRLRRLTRAYGEWTDFDAQAYFDLTPRQAAGLLEITERVTSVHLTFFIDALLPSFRSGLDYWRNHFQPGYLFTRQDPRPAFFNETQPEMVARWQRLLAVTHHTRRLLADDPAFWAMNAANDERLRYRWAWRGRPAPGIDSALLPRLTDVPTLTLSIDFPLPAYRQPGRLRRLRRGRSHLGRQRRRE